MNARAALLTVALVSGGAFAQDLAAYRTVTSALDASVRARPSSPERALAALTNAETAFGRLEDSLGGSNGVLQQGFRETLRNARIANARASVDLEAQVLQARALLRKMLYDATFKGLSGSAANARANAALLASEFGLSAADRTALVNRATAGNAEAVRVQLLRAAGGKINAALGNVDASSPRDAYLNLARATSWFTVVQDEPEASSAGLQLSAFVTALSQLTSKDAAFTGSVAQLRGGAQRFVQAAAGADVPANASASGSAGTGSAGGAGTVVTVTPTTPTTPTPGTTGSTTTGGSTTAPSTGTAPAPGTAATPVAATGVDAVYAALGRALAASGHGDNATAKDALAQASTALGRVPANISGAAGYAGLLADVQGAQGRVGLRPEDVRALVSSLANVEAEASGGAVSVMDRAAQGVTNVWSGPLRALFFLVLAALAFYPLYLLNLAFGGRNAYWRAIGVGLLLLLLPAILEGVANLGVLLGDLTGVGVLRSLGNLSVMQSPLWGPLWAVSVAVAIGLAIYGFRGLCVQFGLLGAKRERDEPRLSETQAAVEWDEEL
ncbi:hypothetical protein [Deinococcus maricopensis]|uniref:Uncharacterized protein n=1 Tax=Deinococcus maricopensis (strain DSM 21211 / LMG 22137 / NRRL B-23946 / LB-34) TaxID=709986 RepID=E8U5H3_DEIML|nr:hypothetical protein [Deinococcus maricopensis]ADV66312.1 hypothetical protein Deima_0655 [Deinococcus maricopensis DSM 21211]